MRNKIPIDNKKQSQFCKKNNIPFAYPGYYDYRQCVNSWDDKYMHIAGNMCNNKWIHTPDIDTAAIDMDANDIGLRRTNLDDINDRCIH